jgi:hypothetical protein
MSESLTTKQVAEHASVENGLYIIIDNDVYKMDSFVDEHPGGAKILKRVGGKDASKQFWKVCQTSPATGQICLAWESVANRSRTVPQRERTEEVCAEAEGWHGEGGGEVVDYTRGIYKRVLQPLSSFHFINAIFFPVPYGRYNP